DCNAFAELGSSNRALLACRPAAYYHKIKLISIHQSPPDRTKPTQPCSRSRARYQVSRPANKMQLWGYERGPPDWASRRISTRRSLLVRREFLEHLCYRRVHPLFTSCLVGSVSIARRTPPDEPVRRGLDDINYNPRDGHLDHLGSINLFMFAPLLPVHTLHVFDGARIDVTRQRRVIRDVQVTPGLYLLEPLAQKLPVYIVEDEPV